MAIAFDAATESDTTWLTNLATLNFNHSTSGSNRFLVVGVLIYDASALTVTGITYNSVAMTKANAISAAVESNNQRTELWYLDNPSTGSNQVSVSVDGTADFIYAIAASYTGKTTTGIDAQNATQNVSSSNSASPACNVNVVASDCWLTGIVFSRDNTLTAGTGTTLREGTTQGKALGDSNGVVGTGNQTLAFNTDGGNVFWPGFVSLSFSEGSGVNQALTGSASTGAQTTPSVNFTVPL